MMETYEQRRAHQRRRAILLAGGVALGAIIPGVDAQVLPEFEITRLPSPYGLGSRIHGMALATDTQDTILAGGQVLDDMGRWRVAVWYWRAESYADADTGSYTGPPNEGDGDSSGEAVFLVAPDCPWISVAGWSENQDLVRPTEWRTSAFGGSWTETVLPTLPGGEGRVRFLDCDSTEIAAGESKNGDGDTRPVIWREVSPATWTIESLPTLPGDEGAIHDLVFGPGPGVTTAVGWSRDVAGKRRPVVWQRIGPGSWTLDPLPIPPSDTTGAIATGAILDGDTLVVVGFKDCDPPYPPASPCIGYYWRWWNPGLAAMTPLNPVIGNVYRPNAIADYDPRCQSVFVGTVFPGTSAFEERVPVVQARTCSPFPNLPPVDLNARIVDPGTLVLRTATGVLSAEGLTIVGDATDTALGDRMTTQPVATFLTALTPIVTTEATSAARPSIGVHPNPFVGRTSIDYAVSTSAPVEVAIFDSSGRLVRMIDSGVRSAGHHTITWDGRNDSGTRVAPGVYFARLMRSGETGVRKIVMSE